MRLETRSAIETRKVGKRIGETLRGGSLIALFGEFGSGKTCMAQGIAAGLGVKEDCVSSPSFVVIKEYQGRLPLYHIDFFRLQTAEEIESTGYSEYICGEGVAVIEWADRIEEVLPEKYLGIELTISGKNKRYILFKPVGKDYEKIAREVYESFSTGYLR